MPSNTSSMPPKVRRTRRLTALVCAFVVSLPGVTLANPQIVVDVFNDTNKDYGVQFEQVFVDHEPFMADRGFDLQRYARAAVQLSDVASAVVATGNANRFMTLYPRP